MLDGRLDEGDEKHHHLRKVELVVPRDVLHHADWWRDAEVHLSDSKAGWEARADQVWSNVAPGRAE